MSWVYFSSRLVISPRAESLLGVTTPPPPPAYTFLPWFPLCQQLRYQRAQHRSTADMSTMIKLPALGFSLLRHVEYIVNSKGIFSPGGQSVSFTSPAPQGLSEVLQALSSPISTVTIPRGLSKVSQALSSPVSMVTIPCGLSEVSQALSSSVSTVTITCGLSEVSQALSSRLRGHHPTWILQDLMSIDLPQKPFVHVSPVDSPRCNKP